MIKLGEKEAISKVIKTLTLLKEKLINKSNEKEPSFLMVLLASGSAYKTKEGIYVVPINLLKA